MVVDAQVGSRPMISQTDVGRLNVVGKVGFEGLAFILVKSNLSGEFTVVNEHLDE